MNNLYIARYESRHFDFEVIANSKDKAKDLLIQSLNNHGKNQDLTSDWFYLEDIQIVKFNINQVYKNGLGRV